MTTRPVRLAARLVAVALLSLPAAVHAQESGVGSRWRLEPMVGVWRQQRDVSSDRLVGPFLGLQFSRARSADVRFTVNGIYHRLDNSTRYVHTNPVTGESRTDVYDREILSFALGVTGNVANWGAAAVSVGFEAGPAWTRSTLEESTGFVSGPFLYPTPGDGSWGLVGFMVPSLALRYAAAPHVEFATTVRLLLGIGDIQEAPIPTLGAGMAYRF